MHPPRLGPICLVSILLCASVLAFIKVDSTPYFLRDNEGYTAYWNLSYSIKVDDMELRLVVGPAETSWGTGTKVMNWGGEIVSVMIDDDELMRRSSFGDYLSNDPIARLSFIGIGGLVSPYNAPMGINPPDAPSATLTWQSTGEEDRAAWTSTYRYSPGDTMAWLNRTFVLNSTLQVDCDYEVTSEYQALQQRITVTNGDAEQYLPFPVETSFCLGTRLKGRGIRLPNMTLAQDNYLAYPRPLPLEWYNGTLGRYDVPAVMWDQSEFPGMLYVEFDAATGDWWGVCTITTYAYDMKGGVGIKLISSDMPSGFRPYCIFVSGPEDHVTFGFKPFDQAGPYDDFVPVKLAPRQSVSVELLWFFPEPKGETMSMTDFEEWAQAAISISEFSDRRAQAEKKLQEANDLAAAGEVDEAVERATSSMRILQELGVLSDAVLEEGRKVNATILAWKAAAARAAPQPERGSRASLLYSSLLVIFLIVGLAGWLYFVKPRRSGSEG